MQCGVGIVPDAEEQYLAVQLVYATNRTRRDVGRNWQRVGGDPRRLGTGRGKREWMVAALHTRQAPEAIRDNAKVGRGRHRRGIEWLVVVGGRRQHDERALRTDRRTQRLDQTQRSALDWPHGTERGMDEQDTALLNTKRSQLVGKLIFAHLFSFWLGLRAHPGRRELSIRSSRTGYTVSTRAFG